MFTKKIILATLLVITIVLAGFAAASLVSLSVNFTTTNLHVTIPASKPLAQYTLGITARAHNQNIAHTTTVTLTCGICLPPAERTPVEPMHVSAKGYQFTKDKEGFNNFDETIHRDCAPAGPNGHPAAITTDCHVTQDRYGLYQDANGFCTRGIGIADYYDNQQPRQHRACTQDDIDDYHDQYGANGQLYNRQAAEAEQHRIEDNFANTVNGYLKVQLTQSQFDAIVDFAYNVGTGNLQSSTLLSHINDRTFTPATISDDWRLFHQVQNRQNQEINMFNNGVYPHPRPQQ